MQQHPVRIRTVLCVGLAVCFALWNSGSARCEDESAAAAGECGAGPPDANFPVLKQAFDLMAKQQYAEALPVLQQLAREGDLGAHWQIGQFYQAEWGVPLDAVEAANWYRLAADLDHDTAIQSLDGLMQRTRDPQVHGGWAANMKWLDRHAEAGYVTAQAVLGYTLFSASEDEADLMRAHTLLQKAAAAGNAHAQKWLGDAYYNGLVGGAVDLGQAHTWYLRAAEQWNASAEMMLTTMYYTGDGTSLDRTQAFRWARCAAEHGHVGAQFLVGLYYSQGVGVPMDMEQAVVWWTQAAEAGLPDAIALLESLQAAADGQ